jgi:hypothetical protein
MIEIDARTIRKADVVEFRDEMLELLNDAKSNKQLAAIISASEKRAAEEKAAEKEGPEASETVKKESNDSAVTAE